MAKSPDRRVCVARIGAAHGVRGDVKLWPFTAEPLAIADYGALETEDGKSSFEIETLRPAKDFLVAHLKGVADRDAAEKLRNTDLYIPRERLPETEQDEFYIADLVGLSAVNREGAELGTVVAVHNFGAGDLLELRVTGARDTVMMAFTEATVPEIDIAAGRIVIDLPQDI